MDMTITVSTPNLIVHGTGPRYTGNPDWAKWGSWEHHMLAISGYGNLVIPIAPP
jgi:hypothetical protein